MPPDRNVFYRKYDCDVFDVLQEQVEIFNTLGTVSVIGDLNGRVGLEPDYIPDDTLDKQLLDNISFINYMSDNNLPQRLSEDTNAPNSVFYNLCINYLGCVYVTVDLEQTVRKLHLTITMVVVLLTICYIHMIECLMRSNHFILNHLTLFHVTHL
jgi:hypothetical protein